jgi:hypothetical protein
MNRVRVFRPLLDLQWQASKWAVMILFPLLVGLPLVVMNFGNRLSRGDFSNPAVDMLRAVEYWSVAFPILAAVTGAVFGLAAWAWDHRTNHVYALALPIERWRYALLKMAAGAVTLALPVLALLAGAVIATATTPLPDGIQAYPVSFAFRFLFAALIVYAIVFALAAGTVRTTFRVALVILVLLTLAGIFASDVIVRMLATWPGPFAVFGGNWMLIDV